MSEGPPLCKCRPSPLRLAHPHRGGLHHWLQPLLHTTHNTRVRQIGLGPGQSHGLFRLNLPSPPTTNPHLHGGVVGQEQRDGGREVAQTQLVVVHEDVGVGADGAALLAEAGEALGPQVLDHGPPQPLPPPAVAQRPRHLASAVWVKRKRLKGGGGNVGVLVSLDAAAIHAIQAGVPWWAVGGRQ